MKKFRFLDKSGLAGDVYFSEPNTGIIAKHAGLFLYGFPAFIGPNSVTSNLVSNGLLSFQPHYFGTYDSKGTNSPGSLLKTIEVTQKIFDSGYVKKSKDGTLFNLPNNLSVCIGHSFGCMVALRAANILHSIKILILMGPALHYKIENPDFGLRENGLEHLDYVKSSHPFTYRLASKYLWKEWMKGLDEIPTNSDHPSLKEVYIVVGEDDKYFNLSALKKNSPQLIIGYLGNKVNINFIAIPNCGHPVDQLMGFPDYFDLTNILKAHKLTIKSM